MKKSLARWATSWLAWGTALCFSWLAPGVALAQDAAEDRAQSFRSVQGAVQEDVPGGPLLVAAYALILACLIAYLVRLLRLQSRAQADLERLEKALATRAAATENDPG